MDFSAAFSAISGAIGTAKHLLALKSVSESAEALLAVAELQSQLADLKVSLSDVKTENADLKERVRELESLQQLDAELERQGNVYFLPSAKEGRRGPFCMTCWDDDKKLIALMGERRICRRCTIALRQK